MKHTRRGEKVSSNVVSAVEPWFKWLRQQMQFWTKGNGDSINAKKETVKGDIKRQWGERKEPRRGKEERGMGKSRYSFVTGDPTGNYKRLLLPSQMAHCSNFHSAVTLPNEHRSSFSQMQKQEKAHGFWRGACRKCEQRNRKWGHVGDVGEAMRGGQVRCNGERSHQLDRAWRAAFM